MHDRRRFLKTSTGAAGLPLAAATVEQAEANTNARRLTKRVRNLFKSRPTRPNPVAEEMKKKHGTPTMLDFGARQRHVSGRLSDGSSAVYSETPRTSACTRNFLPDAVDGSNSNTGRVVPLTVTSVFPARPGWGGDVGREVHAGAKYLYKEVLNAL